MSTFCVFMLTLLRMIEEGATYPYEEAMDAQAFQQAFVAYGMSFAD